MDMSLNCMAEWIDVQSILVFLCIFLLLAEYLRNKAPENFPPGPWSLPVIGGLHHFKPSETHLTFAKFAKKYGNIFSIQIGTKWIIISGHKLVKEALVQNGANFAERPEVPVFHDVMGNKGLIFSKGKTWKIQRRFALSTLRNFGMGKKSLEPSILTECAIFNEAIRDEKGKPFNPQILLNNAVSNVICCLVFGHRFEYSDVQFQTLLKIINEAIILEGGMWATMYNLFPWVMRRIPGPHKKIFSHWATVISFVRSKINQHNEDYDPSSPRDFIDCFLNEMGKSEDVADSGFDMENLCFVTLDLFVAGTETTSTTLHWGLLYMMKYPEIQAKVQAEIDAVVGPSRQASMADRDNMPYTNAVIHEIQRMGNILPLNVFRMAVKDTELAGYTIPKGTIVVGSLTSVLFEESEWETPHTFNPGHFLDKEGKCMNREAFMPFSVGKRACPGEQLARMELFLFFTSLLQRFTFNPPPGVEPSLDYQLGATHCPKPYRLCAVPR